MRAKTTLTATPAVNPPNTSRKGVRGGVARPYRPPNCNPPSIQLVSCVQRE